MRPRLRIATLFALAIAGATLVLCAQGLQQIDVPNGRAGGVPIGVPIGTGLITGQAVDATTGAPLGGVIVTMTGGAHIAAASPSTQRGLQISTPVPVPARRQLTDDSGHFVFTDLPPGSFNLTASRAGYADGAYKRTRPNGPTAPLTLGDAQALGDVKLGLWKLASVSGLVVDDAGEPQVGVQVRALRNTFQAGFARFTPSGPGGSTDDRGVYRIFGLQPGDYSLAIVASETTMPADAMAQYTEAMRAGGAAAQAMLQQIQNSSGPLPTGGGTRVGDFLLQRPGRGFNAPDPSDDGKILTYPTIFYPSAESPLRATIVTLDAGTEKVGVDFRLKATSTVSVSGSVTGPDGPAVNLGLRLYSAGADELAMLDGFETARTLTSKDGHFTFLGVPPGNYVMRATLVQRDAYLNAIPRGGGAAGPAPLVSTPTYWLSVPVSVGDTDVRDVGATLRRGVHLSGYAMFDGSAPKPTPDRLRQIPISIEAADNRQVAPGSPPPMGRFDDQGQFTTTEMLPGSYFVRIGGNPAGWTFKSAMYSGHDLADVALDVTGDLTGVAITFTDQVTTLKGTVHDSNGAGDPTATVIVFPTDSARWAGYGMNPRRIRTIRAGRDGTFQFGMLPAGDYLAAAMPADVGNDWQDPKFLEMLSRVATRLLLSDGDQKTQDLQTLTLPARGGR